MRRDLLQGVYVCLWKDLNTLIYVISGELHHMLKMCLFIIQCSDFMLMH